MGIFNRRGQAEAERFARSVVIGKPYYSVSEINQPWGNEPMYREWIFRRSRLLNTPVCGSETAAGVWLREGPLFDKKPSGMKGIFDPPSVLFDPLGDNGDGYAAYQELMNQRARAGR